MNMEILDEFPGSNIRQIIVKGKRAKRPRPSSSSATSSGCAAAGEFNSSSLVSSPATSSTVISATSTEEDEDMANCLILLAQGGAGGVSVGGSTHEIKPPAESKFSSRRFTEIMATTAADAKVGIYVYECKTCSRTFPSFQALGGHRASHKKPKPTAAAEVDQKKSPPPPAASPPPDDRVAEVAPPTSTQLPRIHECSICGSEFASGQALGGHMRRHRSANNNTTPSNDLHHVGENTRNMFELDLNLPAPPEDGRRETKFHRFPPNQQPRLVFSAAALVDCHY